MKILLSKFKEVLLSVAPITIFVLIMHFTFLPLHNVLILRFLLSSLALVIGMSIFLFGVDLFVDPLGEMSGESIAKSNSLIFVGVAGLLLGFFVSLAEPALHVYAGQVNEVTGGVISFWHLIISVSIGFGIMLAIGLVRSLFGFSFRITILITYLVIFTLVLFVPKEYFVISFDSLLATGAMTVPFLLALNYGVTKLKKKQTQGDGFGLVAMASAGAILGALILGIVSNVQSLGGDLEDVAPNLTNVFTPFIEQLPEQIKNVLLSLTPLVIAFILFQLVFFRLKKRRVKRIVKGIVYTSVGLIIFLLGANSGFMEVGKVVGEGMANAEDWLLVLVAFILGFTIIIAEPSVHILTKQIEDATSGSIKKLPVLASFSIGIGIAISLAVLRIVFPNIELWHYLVPGYIIAFTLMPFVPKLFVGIAFDSGGVASGTMVGTFIFAFVQGAARARGVDLINNGFGMVAMVAFTPFIALQVLGLIYKVKSRKGGVSHAK